MILETKRLRLIPMAPWHWLALMESEDRFASSFGCSPAAGLRGFAVSEDVSPAWVEQLRSAQTVDPWVHGYAVVHRTNGVVVGTAGFKGPPGDDGMVEVAYGIVPSHEGQGLATEAAQALIVFARGHEQVQRIQAHTAPEANASTKVLTKCGFHFIGLVEDPVDGLIWRWEWSEPTS